jgi:hypothetical protein
MLEGGIMSYSYHVGESSLDERHWSISSTRILTKDEINEAFSNADFNIGKRPQTIHLDTGVEVIVVFEGLEFGDDAQVRLYMGEVAEEE